MQTDIILENAAGYMIVDAKYYAAKDAASAPGWPDIAKQIFYEQALREIVDSADLPQSLIHNIFAFPAKTNEGPLANVEVRHTDGRPVSAAFRPVYCVYVSMREVLEHYVNSTQGITMDTPLRQPTDVA